MATRYAWRIPRSDDVRGGGGPRRAVERRVAAAVDERGLEGNDSCWAGPMRNSNVRVNSLPSAIAAVFPINGSGGVPLAVAGS